MAAPSGVHAGSRSHAGPDVTRCHAPDFATTQMSPATLTARRPSREKVGLRTPLESGAGVEEPCSRAVARIRNNIDCAPFHVDEAR